MKAKIAKWGHSAALRLPKPVLSELLLEINSEVDVKVDNGQLIIEPVRAPQMTIEEILDGSPEGSFERTEEDKAWLNAPPVGKEFW